MHEISAAWHVHLVKQPTNNKACYISHDSEMSLSLIELNKLNNHSKSYILLKISNTHTLA